MKIKGLILAGFDRLDPFLKTLFGDFKNDSLLFVKSGLNAIQGSFDIHFPKLENILESLFV